MYCETERPRDMVEYKSKLRAFQSRQSERVDSTLQIQVRYVVLWSNSSNKLDQRFIRANHKTLNDAFNNLNTKELARIPDKAPHWLFKQFIGNPNIQFLPLKEQEVKVVYVKISRLISSSSPVNDAASLGGVQKGVLNVYIGESQGGILGQASINGNIAYVNTKAVGGVLTAGQIPYHLGKTLVHEVGHVFGLWHTFHDDECDHIGITEIEQKAPNYRAQLVHENGQWITKNDNRYQDFYLGTKTSCLFIQPDRNSSLFENPTNYMDYAIDEVACMFSKIQSVAMRDNLLANPYIDIVSQGTIPKPINVNVDTGDDILPATGNENSEDDDKTLIIILVIVGVAIPVFIAFFFLFKYSKNIRQNSTSSKRGRS